MVVDPFPNPKMVSSYFPVFCPHIESAVLQQELTLGALLFFTVRLLPSVTRNTTFQKTHSRVAAAQRESSGDRFHHPDKVSFVVRPGVTYR